MKSLRTNRNLYFLASLVIVVGIVAGFVFVSRDDPDSAPSASNEIQTIQLDVDHPTYSNQAELKADADVVILGNPEDQGQTFVEDQSIATSPSGQDVPSVPMTEFHIKVKKVFKGDVSADEVIVVVLTGGTTGNIKYEVEDFPWLTKGKPTLMYLEKGTDGKYYPLAGGAALANEKDKEKQNYTLPDAVSGKQEIDVSESEL